MALNENDKEQIKQMFKLVHNDDFKQRQIPENDDRNCYERDYARVLYSASFRRLQGKMQILGIDNTSFYRNRLTHSLEVLQIAKDILLRLYNEIEVKSIPIDDVFVLEAAALAHDIGHPAFGHSGERTLDELGAKYDIRFEGNAHNFRVLRYLEKKLPKSRGLNLTYRTLLAINKYIVREDAADSTGKKVKKFMFTKDFDSLQEFRKKHDIMDKRTIDVQIIELADDIAYAAHDLEDGLSTRQFNIDEFIYKLRQSGIPEVDQFEEIVNTAKQTASESETFKTNQEYSLVFRQALTSNLIKLLLSDLSLEIPQAEDIEKRGTKPEDMELTLGKYSALCNKISKEVFKCISREPHICIYEARGKKLLTKLFELYSNPATNHKGHLFPPDYRKGLYKKDEKGNEIAIKEEFVQSAIDYLAGMMDDYAKARYKALFNVDFNDIVITDDSSDKSFDIN